MFVMGSAIALRDDFDGSGLRRLARAANIWQFMRDNWLSNRVFKSHGDIVALCCEAWNKLIDQPWKIMSIGQRKWAHGF